MSDPLSVASKQLRNSNPEGWALFVEAFEQYANDVTATVIRAPSEEILRRQGHAQECQKILQIYKECHLTKSEQPAPR